MSEMIDRVSDALKAEFRTLNAQWFVDDAANDGPCDTTPWTLLAVAAIKAMREPTEAMIAAAAKAAHDALFGDDMVSSNEWPETNCSLDADGFRDAARAAIPAAIDAALEP